MTIPNRAIGPVVKVKRAKEHFDNLATKIVKFIGEKPYRFVCDFDSQTREHIIKIQIVKQPSAFFGAAIGDVIHNLRSALDLLVCQLVEIGGGTITQNTSFPIYDSVNLFEARYIRKVRGASQRAIDMIADLEPYKGGKGDLIWRLHQFDIADKHLLLIPVFGLFPEQPVNITITRPDQPIEFQDTTFKRVFPLENDTEIARFSLGVDSSEVNMNFDAPIRVAFGQPDVVKGQPVLPTLKKFGPYIESVVSMFYPLLT